jgi:hypothetical protein
LKCLSCVNVAVLKETLPHERRVALVPSVVLKLIKLGAKLHMQSIHSPGFALVSYSITSSVNRDRRPIIPAWFNVCYCHPWPRIVSRRGKVSALPR